MESGFASEAAHDERSSEIDIRALWAVLVRKRLFIILPTCAAFLLTWLIVSLVTPRYTAQSQVLIENQENFFTRPQKDQVSTDGASLVDPEAVGSQIQLLTSRDLARRAIKALELEGNSEFDPLAKGIGPISRVLILLGLIRDPTRLSPEERILETFSERLSVYSPTKTRVLTIDFQSRDPELAARAANKIAELYLSEQSDAKRARAKAAATSLRALISELRGKLTDASAKVEEFRSNSGLLAGTNNMTISGQQLAELNSELSKARTSQADAQAKASLIRDMIKQGRISDVPDVANNDLVRRIAEQRVTVRAQLASESRTLLPGHPRIKELTAQIADLDKALRAAAEQTVHSLENEASIAGNRVANLEAVLNQQKKVAGVANTDEIHLHELERIADAYRDQLDGSTTKYQEAMAREDSPATPADARVISQATIPTEASYPKKLPLVIFATLATFLGTSGFVVSGELLSGRAAVGAGALRAGILPRRVRAPRVFAQAEAIEPRLDMPPPQDSEEQAAQDVRDEPQEEPLAHVMRLAAFLANQILAKPEAETGSCIVMTGQTRKDVATGLEIALGRELAQHGHAIILDLDGHTANFEPLFAPWLAEEMADHALAGLTDLLSGEASFAEVIHRDDASRLHFIASGRQGSFEIGDFDLVLEALAQTYDFILLMAPPLDRNQTAVIAAGHADFVVLEAEAATKEDLANIKLDLLAAGAKDVIILDGSSSLMPIEHQDVA